MPDAKFGVKAVEDLLAALVENGVIEEPPGGTFHVDTDQSDVLDRLGTDLMAEGRGGFEGGLAGDAWPVEQELFPEPQYECDRRRRGSARFGLDPELRAAILDHDPGAFAPSRRYSPPFRPTPAPPTDHEWHTIEWQIPSGSEPMFEELKRDAFFDAYRTL
jgi:hypothetical protein